MNSNRQKNFDFNYLNGLSLSSNSLGMVERSPIAFHKCSTTFIDDENLQEFQVNDQLYKDQCHDLTNAAIRCIRAMSCINLLRYFRLCVCVRAANDK